MAHFDLPLAELVDYLPERAEPADFEGFWRRTLDQARQHPLDAVFTDIDEGYSELITQEVEFSGYGGDRIRGWFLAPRHRSGPLPVVVSYIGYGGGRGLVGSWTGLPSAGIAQFVMDSRGQGSGHRPGVTGDGAFSGPHSGGVMTLGIEDPERYYYRRLFTDAVRAVEAAASHPLVDPGRIIVSGASQGGGITLAAAALAGDAFSAIPECPTPIAAIADVPFLCHFDRALTLTDAFPYGEVVRYLHIHRDRGEQALATLSHFDGMHFAARAGMPALFSVGLMDRVCPPSTVYAAHNHYAGEKRMVVYPFNGHEHGAEFQSAEHLRFIREQLGWA